MKLDWRVWFGVSATVAYLLLALAYVLAQGMEQIVHLPAENLGSFLEGAFAPLAFLWLVIGYFLQRQELHEASSALRAQHEEIRLSNQQAIIQTESLKTREVHARQQAYLDLAGQMRAQLGMIAGFLYISSQAADAGGSVSLEEQGRMFKELSANDNEIFSREIINYYLATEDTAERYAFFYGTPIRARHSNHFALTFENLLKRAEQVDAEYVFRNALLYSAHGIVYRVLKDYRERAPAELSSTETTGTYFDIRFEGESD